MVRLASLVVLALVVMPALATEAQKYNVMYFIVDDLRPEFMSAYGQGQMITPNIDKLAKTGTVFNNAYCQQAVCGPSRASFMTGRRPDHTNVFDNNKCFRDIGHDNNGKGANWVTFPGHFKNSNWTTLGGGKTFHPRHPPNWDGSKSWDSDKTYFPFDYYKPNPDYPKGPCRGPGGPGKPANPSDHSPSHIDTWCAVDEPDENFYDYGLANDTIDRLRYVAPLWKNHGKPFFLASGWARPHAPWRVPLRMWNLYNSTDIPLAKHQLPPDNMPGIAWKQDGFYNATNGDVFLPHITKPLDVRVQKLMRRAYYSAVTWMDTQVGRVMDEMEALDLVSSTIVLIHGDHGWQLGEHNSWHKFTNFELGTRVPLIVRVPWKTASIGKRVNMMVELIDVYPTIAALANTPPPSDELDGVSLAPVFDDPTLLSIPTDKGTVNKSVAFSQYPHSSDFNCPFERGGQCYNTSGAITDAVEMTVDPLRMEGEMNFMGFRVRDKAWAYCVWVAWDTKTQVVNWPAPSLMLQGLEQLQQTSTDSAVSSLVVNGSTLYLELYDHSTDTGNDFDAMDLANVAYDSANAAVVAAKYRLAFDFFHTYMPPTPSPGPGPGPSPGPGPAPGPAKTECKSAGGILDHDSVGCCPTSCGQCGGKGCAKLPGGKANCCTKEIEGNGKDCKTSKAPCSIH